LPPDQGFDVIEEWTFTDCPNPAAPIRRLVQYGCFGDTDCQEKGTEQFISTAVEFGIALPDITLSIQSQGRPACYVDELTPVDIRIQNSGTAPTDQIVIRINAGGGAIDISNYSILDGMGAPISDQTPEVANADAGHCTMGIRTLTDTIKNISLEPGMTLVLHYDLAHSCACNNCSIQNIYNSQLSVLSFSDPCGGDLTSNNSVSTADFDAVINGFVQGPVNLNNDEKATIEYVVTSVALDWLNANYPTAYLESIFTLECGIDYQAGTIAWTDSDGTIWPTCEVEYIDGGLGADDMLRVRWCKADRPATGFNIESNMRFTLCIEADCSEKDIASGDCANPAFNTSISQNTFLTIDPSCTDCITTKVFDPQPLNLQIFCPNPMGCPPCEGLVFESLEIKRTTLGLGDSNNDQIPDGPVDPSLIQSDQFIQGDTLQATFVGTISDPNDDDWAFGFAAIEFPNNNFTPLSATVQITDASTGIAYNCDVVPVTVDNANSELIVNFSRDILISLGCNLPADFHFDESDEVIVVIDYQIKDPFDGMVRLLEYPTDFYVSDADLNMGTEYTCNDRMARLYQVGLTTGQSINVDNFGACEVSRSSFTYDRHIGSSTFDEFPYEIRTLGIPKTFTFTKPAEFAYRPDQFGIRLEQEIPSPNNIVNLPNGPIPTAFINISGDEVTFLAEDYFNSISNLEIPPDEGYRVVFWTAIQGTCESIPADYSIESIFSESVAESIYCTDMITRPLDTRTVNYSGAAELQVVALSPDLRVCSGADTVEFRVDNLTLPAAANSFLYINSPTGGVIVQQVIDLGNNTVLTS
jgi:hypothetical protein